MRETVAIVGAGPYGLSMAAHLRHHPGLEVRVYGKSMSFWQGHMPKGMLLRSGWRASYIADPGHALSLEAYQSDTGDRVPSPVPLDKFVSYGKWFQKKVAPEVDTRLVQEIARTASNFQLKLEDGETVEADRVIVATGIAPFAHVPSEFAGLPRSLATHTANHRDFSCFRGKSVAVVGGGQSALESAALLSEAGAEVQVFVRESQVHFLGWRKRIMKLDPLFKLLYSWTDVGPAGLSQLVSHPDSFRALPRGVQDPIARRCIRPAGAGWLPDRLKGVALRLGTRVIAAQPTDSRLQLRLSDGPEGTVDHLLMGTGYKIEISKYGFLSEGLLASIRQANGYPVLNDHFESSVAGLYFLGAPAAWSFGPLMRFVAGTEFGCARLAAGLGNGRQAG